MAHFVEIATFLKSPTVSDQKQSEKRGGVLYFWKEMGNVTGKGISKCFEWCLMGNNTVYCKIQSKVNVPPSAQIMVHFIWN
jgi:hypothetical protein